MSSKSRSHSPSSAKQGARPGELSSSIDASGMFPADLRLAIRSRASQSDRPISVTNLHRISELQNVDYEASARFLETLDQLVDELGLEDVAGNPQTGGVTLHQDQAEYDRSLMNSGLDADTDGHNIAITTLDLANVVERSDTSTEGPPPGDGSQFGERWKRMADKQEESHFVHEMAKDLAPYFDALRTQSEKLDQRLEDVNSRLIDQGYALSGVARRLDEFYTQTIIHNQSLENEITALRQEMSQSSARTNALLETIAQSLQRPAAL